MRRNFCSWLVLGAGLWGPSGAVAGQAQFLALGDLPGGNFDSRAWGVSNGGRVVVGGGETSEAQEAFRWTAETGMIGLGDLPGGAFDSYAYDVSADGSVVGGQGTTPGGGPFRWTAETGMVSLGGIPGSGTGAQYSGLSADGTTVVGYGANPLTGGAVAFRWRAETGMVSLGTLLGDTPARSNVSAAYAVNGDGSVVVGRSNSIHDSEPMRWSETGGMIGLGRIPGAAYGGVALAVSSDGSVVVGQANGIAGGEAFRWTAATGMIGLGDLPGGIFRSGALGISGDGSLIVGQASIDSSIGIPGGITTAMIWDAQHGMRQLEAALVQDYGLALPGWWLYAATAVSQDGSAIVGWGKNPQGNQEAFLVLLPEPASAGLLALAMVLFPRRRVG